MISFSVKQQTRFNQPIRSLLISISKSTDDSVILDELRYLYPTATIRSKWGNYSIWMQFKTTAYCSEAIPEIEKLLQEKL